MSVVVEVNKDVKKKENFKAGDNPVGVVQKKSIMRKEFGTGNPKESPGQGSKRDEKKSESIVVDTRKDTKRNLLSDVCDNLISYGKGGNPEKNTVDIGIKEDSPGKEKNIIELDKQN